jgi:hypothetical protein
MESDAAMYPYIEMFPDGIHECRVAHTSGHEELPDDEYGFVELYCTGRECDCKRVMINVIASTTQKHLATINYGFDSKDDMPGPFLDPLNNQSKYSKIFLSLFEQFIKDPKYLSRIRKHYKRVKTALKDPTHIIHTTILT